MGVLASLQRDAEALKVARNVLRKDPAFLDVRCACTAFLWAMGETAAAEGEWIQLQKAQGVLLMLQVTCMLLDTHVGRVTVDVEAWSKWLCATVGRGCK